MEQGQKAKTKHPPSSTLLYLCLCLNELRWSRQRANAWQIQRSSRWAINHLPRVPILQLRRSWGRTWSSSKPEEYKTGWLRRFPTFLFCLSPFYTFIFKVYEYLEGIGRLHGKLSHVLDVLEECFQGSNDQVYIFKKNISILVTIFHCWQSSDVTTWIWCKGSCLVPLYLRALLNGGNWPVCSQILSALNILYNYSFSFSQTEEWRQRVEVLQLWKECSVLRHIWFSIDSEESFFSWKVKYAIIDLIWVWGLNTLHFRTFGTLEL